MFKSLLFLFVFLTSVSLTALAQQKINLNKATLEELKSLPGIGDVTARRIIEYREKVGGFKNLEELKNVKGIGDKKLEDLKNYLFVEDLSRKGDIKSEDHSSSTKNSTTNRPLYYYKDERGIIHYTQFPDLVPERYRKNLRQVK